MPTEAEAQVRMCRCGETMTQDIYPGKAWTCWHCDGECEALTKADSTGKINKCKKCERQLDKATGQCARIVDTAFAKWEGSGFQTRH